MTDSSHEDAIAHDVRERHVISLVAHATVADRRWELLGGHLRDPPLHGRHALSVGVRSGRPTGSRRVAAGDAVGGRSCASSVVVGVKRTEDSGAEARAANKSEVIVLLASRRAANNGVGGVASVSLVTLR